jgi:hypothetical protein
MLHSAGVGFLAGLAVLGTVSPLWYTVIGAAIAVAGSIIGSLVVSRTTLRAVDKAQREENQRAAARDRAHLRDIKGDRLRELYAPLVGYALLLQKIAGEEGTSPRGGETRDEMNTRHERLMAEGRASVEEVRAALLVESGTEPVWAAYETTVGAWWTVHESIRVVFEDGVHIDQSAFNETLSRAQSAAEHLRTIALDQLKAYEHPVDASDDDQRERLPT